MTRAYAERKSSLVGVLIRIIAGIALVAAIGQPPLAAGATTERIVVDWHTGLAIYGFDPVAYFTDGMPRIGRPEFEYTFGGATWRFRNEGNRAAFIDRPDVYMPEFGGYDPIGVARGLAAPGHPQFWLIAGQRLYLFRGADSRTAFKADPARSAADAGAGWPSVMKGLIP